ncbi:MAG: amidohydrolase family protein [Lewinellaceae bacterium]|nr:amidohydrolase family protein [Saprospiraceae bacterium]MCB9339450.1 amidohydrolase family protein [Lewinellaceae bacterium]
MKHTIGIIIILIFLASCSNQHYTIIRDVNVFDGENVLEDVDFVFTQSGIERISKKKKSYKNSTIIDGKGKTILPPLINAHVHVRSSENLKEAQKVGIFGMLDMFSIDSRANGLRVYNDSTAYSKFYSSNVGATPPGGHGTQFGINIPTINDTISPSQFVKDRVAQNADYIKITNEFSMSRLDTIQLKELINEAHNHNKITVAHISDLQNGLEVINQNIDGLAHIWYRSNSISKERDLNLLRAKEVFVIPTLSVIIKVINHANEIGLKDDYLTLDELKNEVRKLKNKGICILAGTDSPNYNMNYTTQFFEELLLLSECGLTEIEVLKSATTNIYEKFHLEEFNRLEVNRKSSFLLVTGKPYLRIEDIMNEKRIWKNGIEIS